MRRLPILVCLCALTASPIGADAGQRTAPASGLRLPDTVAQERIEGLERWLKAVARHLPGEDDQELRDLAEWPNADLKTLWLDANVLSQIIRSDIVRAMNRSRNVGTFSVRAVGQKTPTAIRYSGIQMRRMTALACAAGGVLTEPPCMAMGAADELDPDFRRIASLARAARLRGDDNYIMRRGAILHSDVAILAPLAMKAPARRGRPAGSSVSAWRSPTAARSISANRRCTGRSRTCCSISSCRAAAIGRRRGATRWCANGIGPLRRGCSCARTTTSCTSIARVSCFRRTPTSFS